MVSRAVDVERSPTPLAALVPSYRPIFDRLLAVCEGDWRLPDPGDVAVRLASQSHWD
jgi:hypothetical protein